MFSLSLSSISLMYCIFVQMSVQHNEKYGCFLFPHVNTFFLEENHSIIVGLEIHTVCCTKPLGASMHSGGMFITSVPGQ